ncbi:unnamed protein product [Ambrosiozyma monospora]|uniref:Unnamed protein product n=1 Tax=Ambrosiozyma monospora TaxID=43982 RepID=A0ACB5T5G3_AMBMO|nr:unnamed protein product [Ambrosiozyma monospora]
MYMKPMGHGHVAIMHESDDSEDEEWIRRAVPKESPMKKPVMMTKGETYQHQHQHHQQQQQHQRQHPQHYQQQKPKQKQSTSQDEQLKLRKQKAE